MEVYFDNSATTKPYKEVIQLMGETMENIYGNPSSAHKLGLIAENKLTECREYIGKTLNCSKDEIIFTSGGSESNNFLIKGFISEGNEIITSRIEHPSILNVCKELEKQNVNVVYLDVDSKGKINIEQLENAISNKTQIISIMHVNNETGVVQDLAAIGRLIKEKSSRAKFHVDAVQSYGKSHIDVQKMKIDLLSASGHKIHGPRGVGFAYVRKGLTPKPLILGGGQEKNHRSGTENLAGIMGLKAAAEIMNSKRENNFKYVSEIKQYFLNKLENFEGIKINSPFSEEFSPYVVSVSFIGVRAEVLLHLLEEANIYVSTGSACHSKNTKDSHVLNAMGLKDQEIKGTVRFSFNEANTKDEIDYTMDILHKSLRFLRRVSK